MYAELLKINSVSYVFKINVFSPGISAFSAVGLHAVIVITLKCLQINCYSRNTVDLVGCLKLHDTENVLLLRVL
jgi:hypothetical protein